MQPAFAQPDAVRLPDVLIRRVVAACAPDAAAGPIGTTRTDVHSNDLATARLPDGRALIIKRGRYPWSAARFDTSRRASRLIRSAGIVAPAPLDAPAADDPLETYWRIELPTLDELWPELDAAQRRSAMRSLGVLARRVHGVELPGFGPLERMDGASLAGVVEPDIAHRMLPAAWGEWPQGAPLVERLLRSVPDLARRTADRRPVLVHNDLHLGNVLCERRGEEVRCVGLLDLEAAAAGLPESDLAMMELLQGPLFGRPLDGEWLREVRTGYGAGPDPWPVAFFRALHLLNLGFYSAHVGHHEHADLVAAAAEEEVARLSLR